MIIMCESMLKFFAINEGGKVKLYLLLSAFLIFRILFGGKISVETLYQLNTPLCWNSIKIGNVT